MVKFRTLEETNLVKVPQTANIQGQEAYQQADALEETP
jgi:hypothetical protein